MAKNSSLEKARAAYSKNKNTKYTWKDGKKSEKKKPKKKKKETASHYGQVEKKTQTAGKQGEANRTTSRAQSASTAKKVGSAFKKNAYVNKTQNKPQTSKPNQYKGASRSGTKVTPVQVSKGDQRRRADTRAGLSSVKNTINPRTVGGGAFVTDTTQSKVATHYGQVAKNTLTYGKEGEKNRKKFQKSLYYNYDDKNADNYLGKDATAKGTAAGRAYNRSKTGKYNQYKAGEKTVTVDTKKEKEANATAIYKESTKSEKNTYDQVYNAYYKRLSGEYDKAVKQYGEDAVRRQFGSKDEYIESSLGKREDFIKDNLDAGKEDRIKSANEQAEKDSKYTYSNAPISTNEALIQQNASLFQNTKVKTKTDKDRYVTDKNGNIKYDITFDEKGNPVINPKKKKGKEKVDTTQGANIIDYYAGGFNEKGELASQKGSQKVANTRAGWLRDSKFMAGVLQGSSYGDITRGLGQYSRAAGKDVDKTKQSGLFNAGYVVGQGTQFMIGGTAKMTDALVKGVGRKGLERSVKNIGLRKGAADVLFEAPINTLDAFKMSTDSNGNFNKKAFLGYMALNSGLSGGIGSVIGGVGAKMSKSQAQDFLRLAVKAESGVGLTEAEAIRLQGIQKKFAQMRESGNVANADIANKAEYDAIVASKVFDKGGTAEEAYKLINNTGTNVEKMNMSASIKENADIQFELLRAERDNIIEQMAKASPEERAKLGRQAAELRTEMNRLGEIANTADTNLKVAKRQNRTSLRDLTGSLENMSKRTGIDYSIVDDVGMRKTVTDVMAREADKLEAAIKDAPPEEREALEAKVAELRQGASDDVFYKGFYYKDENGETKVLVNSESPQAYQTVVGHETGHLIKKASEDEFYALGDTLEKYAKEFGDYDAVVEEISRSYPNATATELREEVICELLGRYVYGANDKVLKRIAGEKTSLLTRIVDYFKELLSKTTDRAAARELTAIIDKIDSLTDNVGVKLTKDGKVKEGTYSVDDDIQIEQLDKSGATLEKDGEPVVQFDKDGSMKFSQVTYKEDGRPVILNFVDKLKDSEGLTKAEGEDIVHSMDTVYDICKRLADKTDENGNPIFASFSQWSYASVKTGKDGKPLMTAHVKDDEYPIDFDFSTVCVRRENLDAALDLLAQEGVLERLFLADEAQQGLFVGKMNDIIRSHGLETSCEVCYVDVKRPRMFGTAREFADTHNDLVESLYKDKSKIDSFNYGGDKTVARVDDGIHTLDDSELDFTHVHEVLDEERQKAADAIENGLKKIKDKDKLRAQTEKMNALRSGEMDSGSVRSRMAKAVLNDPSQRKLFSVNDVMSSQAIERMRQDNPSLEKLINSKKGQRGTKLPLPNTQYLGEIIKKNGITADKAWAMGGFRAQSYSDYNANLVMEYVQMFGEAALKQMPAQIYSKVPMEIMQFGLTGAKQNMSMIPAVKKGCPAGLDENGNYLWDVKQSFPWELARKIQNADGYKDNCGTIAIGVSDEQIAKMLKDPEIHMVIPYHASTVNPVVAQARKIGGFKNYEHSQITRTKSGGGVSNDFPWNEKIHALTHDENHKLKPREEWGNPQDVVDEYLRWCEEHNYTPKFPEFAYHEDPEVRAGYYKLLTDYSMFDNNGNFTPQMAVQARFPQEGDAFGSMASLVEKGLRKQKGIEAKRKKEVKAIADETIEMAKKNGWLSDDFKASAAGVKAQGADRSAADLALSLKADGLSNDEIKEITGWYIAKDGKPRFEFSDSGFKIKDSVYADYHPEKATSDRVLITASEKRDDAMREFYTAAQDADPHGQGAFDIMLKGANEGKTIGDVRKELQAAAKEGKIPKETATVDTALATKYTKYVKSEQGFSKKSRGTASPTSERLADVIDHDELFKFYPEAKDVKVNFVNSTKDGSNGFFDPRTNSITVARGRSKDDMESTLIHEIQHWIQHKEGHANGASESYWNSVIQKIEEKLVDIRTDLSVDAFVEFRNASTQREKLNIIAKDLGRAKARQFKALEKLQTKIQSVVEDMDDAAYDAYYSTLGEQEARNTSVSRRYTESEIENSGAPFYAKEDTPSLVKENFDNFFYATSADDFKFSQEAKPKRTAEEEADLLNRFTELQRDYDRRRNAPKPDNVQTLLDEFNKNKEILKRGRGTAESRRKLRERQRGITSELRTLGWDMYGAKLPDEQSPKGLFRAKEDADKRVESGDLDIDKYVDEIQDATKQAAGGDEARAVYIKRNREPAQGEKQPTEEATEEVPTVEKQPTEEATTVEKQPTEETTISKPESVDAQTPKPSARKTQKPNSTIRKNAESAKAEAQKKIDALRAERESAAETSAGIANKQRNTSKFSNAPDKAEKLKELKAQRAESDAKIAEIDKQIEDANKELAMAQSVIDENAGRLAKGRKAKTAQKVERLRSEIEGLESDIRAKEAEIEKMDSKKLDGMSLSAMDKHLDERNKLVHEVEELQSRIKARTDEISKSTLLKSQREALEKPATPKPKETPKAETPKAEAPKVEEPAATPAATKPEVPTSQTKTKAAEFRNTEEYKTFTETPSSYASDRLKQMTEAAMNYDVDVSKRIAEYNALGKEVRANRAKAKNSKTLSHIQEYERLAEEAEIRQTQIAESIYLDVKDKRLEVKGIDATSLKEVSSAIESVGGVKTMAQNVKRAMPKNKATKLAEQEVKDFDKCLDNFAKGDPDKGLQNARAGALLDDIAKRLDADPNDTKAVSDLMKVVDVLGDNSTLPANVRNSAKTLATATPKGRLGVAVNAVETLNKKYAERIEGTLSLTEEEKVKLATTPQGDELDQLYYDITCRLWDQIPASRMEKFNEIRHMFMLANLRTHGRNFFGNVVFRGVRRVADDMEIGLQNTLFKRGIEKRGGQVERVRVAGAEIRENDEYLTKEFHEAYDASGSVSRYMEVDRPDGVPVVKLKALNWLIQKNYGALEAEDMFTFIPAFKKSYAQYVKAKGWDIHALTDAQKKLARERALFDAEYATFRDITAFSSWVTGKKHWLAQKEGNTIFGTAMYRLMNAALEGVLPFVKTPVNILRRAVDFSPISLFRGLAELSRTDPDTYMLGIKHLSTGLTGTGIFGLGFLLADLGHVSIDTKLGGHSGSKYYDQDMGYQDYSLVVHVGDYHKSFSLDWVQPMEASLFMGAACKDMVEDFMAEMKDPENNDFSIGTDLISGLFAVTSPMLDASFMSSTKDMIETFERRAGHETAEGEPDMAGALAQMLFADIPKNYVSSIVPQVVSQVANASDKYQRDTRSTMKDPIAAAWDSAGKQLINRIPVLRQYALNPKLDRWGDDKRTGRNVALRIFDSIANPSTVREINENRYDRELFKIRNDLPKGSKQYKNFFYNFTGNPNYDLDFGKGRMSYDQAYYYGQAVRKEQGKMVKNMIDSDTYKDYMNTDMKAQEVEKSYWTAVYKGDQTIGNGYAAKRIIANEDGEDEAWAEYKRMNAGKKGIAKEFVDFYIKKEELYQRAHPTAGNDSYNIKALACYMYNKKMLDAYDVHPDKRENVSKYWKSVLKEAGGDKKTARETAIKETTLFTVGSTYYLKENDAGKSKKMQSVALGMMAVDGNKSPERVYRGMGFDWNEAQAGGGLMLHYNRKGKYKGQFTFEKLKEMQYDLKHNFKNEEGKVGKAETINYVESLGIDDQDLKACIFQSLCPTDANNPYGTIKDWLEWNTDPDEYGSGGWGRRGRRGGWGHGGGGGGGGGKTPFTPVVNTAGKDAKLTSVKVGDPFRARDYTKPSNIDEAYRKKARKLREQSRKRV